MIMHEDSIPLADIVGRYHDSESKEIAKDKYNKARSERTTPSLSKERNKLIQQEVGIDTVTVTMYNLALKARRLRLAMDGETPNEAASRMYNRALDSGFREASHLMYSGTAQPWSYIRAKRLVKRVPWLNRLQYYSPVNV